jgi:hypothetical protein
MMITIADAYDAMRSKWPYEGAFTVEKLYEKMIELSGEVFHPGLIDIFFNKVGLYPPGTLVELDSGAIGLVVKESGVDMRRPYVEILYNSNGEEEKEIYTIDLSEKENVAGKYKWTIVKSIPVSDKYAIPDRYKMR